MRKSTGRPKGSSVTPPEIRFWVKVIGGNFTECWLWQGAHDKKGYGHFYVREGVWLKAYRFAYITMRADVPDGLHLDHLCRNPPCVNPWHLEPVTRQVNTRRWADTITHCPQGHEYTPENTRIGKRGLRNCRRCDADRAYIRRGQKHRPRRYKYPDFQPIPAGKHSGDPFA